MTLFITLAFLVRSSSLVGWIPLALIKALSSRSYFLAIIEATVTVAVPVTAASILADSLFYGKFTIAPINFLYVNVLDNLSQYFGLQDPTFYLKNLSRFVSVIPPCTQMVFFGFCLFTVY